MGTVRFTTLLGFGIGAVWAVTDAGGALTALAATAVGLLVGLVLERRIDLRELLRDSDDSSR